MNLNVQKKYRSQSIIYDVLKHATKWMKKYKWKADIIVALPPTTPFRNYKHIDRTLELLIKKKAKSAITITEPSIHHTGCSKKKR